jgi:hypothetical protein
MDLCKELDEINSKGVNPRSLMDEMHKEKKDLENKLHILNVLAFVKEMKELHDAGIFKKNSIKTIEIKQEYDYENHSAYYMLECFNKKGEICANQKSLKPDYNESYGTYREVFKTIRLLLATLYGNGEGFINENFKENDKRTIKIEKGFDEQLLDLFLKKEFRGLLKYSEMKNELINNGNIVSKRPKL